ARISRIEVVTVGRGNLDFEVGAGALAGNDVHDAADLGGARCDRPRWGCVRFEPDPVVGNGNPDMTGRIAGVERRRACSGVPARVAETFEHDLEHPLARPSRGREVGADPKLRL